MKKIVLALFAIWSLEGADHDLYRHSVEGTGAYFFNDDDMRLQDEWGWGVRYQYNFSTVNSWEVGAIQVAFDYQSRSDYVGGGDSSVSCWGLNTLWYMDNPSDLTPYALLGIGIRFFSDEEWGNNDGLFAALGGGLEYQLRGDFSLVGEGKWLYGGDENSVVTSVGIKYSFGQ